MERPEDRYWVLGARDQEMDAIRDLLVAAGEQANLPRVVPSQRVAYSMSKAPRPGDQRRWYAVECDGPEFPDDTVYVGHHRACDPNYERHPAQFMAASSLGQVIETLAERRDAETLFTDELRWQTFPEVAICAGEICYWQGLMWVARLCDPHEPLASRRVACLPVEYPLIAAADHCLHAAYRGKCPGAAPDVLFRFRVDWLAKEYGMTVQDVESALIAARGWLECPKGSCTLPRDFVLEASARWAIDFPSGGVPQDFKMPKVVL